MISSFYSKLLVFSHSPNSIKKKTFRPMLRFWFIIRYYWRDSEPGTRPSGFVLGSFTEIDSDLHDYLWSYLLAPSGWYPKLLVFFHSPNSIKKKTFRPMLRFWFIINYYWRDSEPGTNSFRISSGQFWREYFVLLKIFD